MQIYLNSFGTYLHVKDAMFEIRVPNERGGTTSHHLAAKKVTAIILTVAGALSSDAVRLALAHNVDLILADHSGQPLGRFWHAKLGSTTKIRKQQLAASIGPLGLGYTGSWLTAKIAAQADFLKDLKKHRKHAHELLDERRSRLLELAASIETCVRTATRTDEIADTLRGLEGTAGRLYWQTLSALTPEPYQFAGRSFRPAADPFNAFINYGYGILYARVEKALMTAGLDPYVGFMHRDDYNQKSMVFDFIEPYRPWVDRVVFRLFSGKQVNTTHYGDLAGGVTLEKPGKELLISALGEYLDGDKVRHHQRVRSRANGMLADAHRFAQELLGKDLQDLEIVEL
ncbi:CRISPR-associated endonuclease Cas1 [Neolewinella lacunae]|uniref:CRISPR-associated endonuclease Cas1 n=1 Tax=Neolewinella lacunae TaxID=1517758 RepID=A0A923PNR3_9BACT|nr:CRISPR-associated endonuclease Cas1 [Neolewinella lacunae]MBC6994623.1 CRISPR-associated endonuclease Cas1 [Neolewinella lacunae]MDN3634495.1 CRISPR-associated endonuclease Cas1 [Neolewinella lacunae]